MRADAVRSRAAILDAAVRMLERGTFGGLGEVAAEAGVTRQTIYAHFPTRQDLLTAVVERLVGDNEAVIAQARLDEGPAGEALGRLFAAGRQLNNRGGVALANLAAMSTPEESAAQHDPVMDELGTLMRRGQASGEFDASMPARWLATVAVALGHAAGSEAAAGRLSEREADRLALESVLRVIRQPGAGPTRTRGSR
jgi:AcrR family transcriptional regulator